MRKTPVPKIMPQPIRDKQMTSALYNREILALAASLIYNDRLENPDATANSRAPLCGSLIEADIILSINGKIIALALRANACALGQASAAILRKNAAGHDAAFLQNIRGSIIAYFNGTGEISDIWPQLAAIKVAKDYPARHAAILLPYDALLEAYARASK
jgi:NifU-like protein involved in Fe-S cluster formation